MPGGAGHGLPGGSGAVAGRGRKQFDLAAIGQGQVKLPRVALLPVMLGEHTQAEDAGVEVLERA
jgi:hypothetical protein